MNLIDKEKRPLSYPRLLRSHFNRFAKISNSASHSTKLHKMTLALRCGYIS